MAATEPEVPASPSPADAARPPWWRVLLPYVITAAVAIAGSLLIQATILRPSVPTIVVPTTPPTSAAPTPPPATPAPAATVPPPAVDIVRQELEDLRFGQDQLWAAVYLSKAISQLSDAETVLRQNDLPGVDQALIAVDDSLALAYNRADSSMKDPILERRRQVDRIREDLFLRPEDIDARLAQLRGLILSLIEAGS